jgi:acetylornithine deacetylase/succinyl-diaminopimelate desuccinylase-like protein
MSAPRFPVFCALILSHLAASWALAAEPGVREWRQANEHAILRQYFELLSLPNVARDDADVSANARWLEQAFSNRGFAVQMSADRAAPVVLATYSVPQPLGTLLFYIHYDGQPVTPSEWTWCPPFKPCLVGPDGVIDPATVTGAFDPEWRLYARSAADDKGPIAALLGAVDALQTLELPLLWNLKVVLDGQEEAGSANFRRFLAAQPDLFSADLALTLDGPQHPSRRPTLYFGVRGGASLTLTVHTAQGDLHSGNYGNWAPDPSFRLAQLLSSMKDQEGRVLIDGFYDDVTPLTALEQAALAAMPVVEDELMQEFGIARPEMPDIRLEEKLNLPTLNILAMDAAGGMQAPARTAIPASASARIAMRLVAGINPAKQQSLVIEHIRRQGYEVILNRAPSEEELRNHALLARVDVATGRAATRVPLELPEMAGVAAAATLDGQAPVLLPTLGGSLPFAEFSEGLGLPTVGLSLVNHDNNQHAPDENLRLANLWQGMEILAAILRMPKP